MAKTPQEVLAGRAGYGSLGGDWMARAQRGDFTGVPDWLKNQFIANTDESGGTFYRPDGPLRDEQGRQIAQIGDERHWWGQGDGSVINHDQDYYDPYLGLLTPTSNVKSVHSAASKNFGNFVKLAIAAAGAYGAGAAAMGAPTTAAGTGAGVTGGIGAEAVGSQVAAGGMYGGGAAAGAGAGGSAGADPWFSEPGYGGSTSGGGYGNLNYDTSYLSEIPDPMPGGSQINANFTPYNGGNGMGVWENLANGNFKEAGTGLLTNAMNDPVGTARTALGLYSMFQGASGGRSGGNGPNGLLDGSYDVGNVPMFRPDLQSQYQPNPYLLQPVPFMSRG